IGTLTVESFLVDHPVEAYALRITDAAGRVITYSGDSDECDNLVAAASGADLFLCEAAFQEDRDTARGIHLTGKRAGRVAQNAEASALVLTHIPIGTDCSIVRGEAAGEFRGPIDLAKPGAAWTVRAPCPPATPPQNPQPHTRYERRRQSSQTDVRQTSSVRSGSPPTGSTPPKGPRSWSSAIPASSARLH